MITWYSIESPVMNSCSFVSIFYLFSFLANMMHLYSSHICKPEYMNIHGYKYRIKLNTGYFSSDGAKTTVAIGKKSILSLQCSAQFLLLGWCAIHYQTHISCSINILRSYCIYSINFVMAVLIITEHFSTLDIDMIVLQKFIFKSTFHV